MDEKSYISEMKNILSAIGLRFSCKRKWKETTHLLPFAVRDWTLPIHSVALSHDAEKIKEGTIEIWIYLFAAFYNYKKICGKQMVGFLAFSAAAQIGLVKLYGYEYDRNYECHDGSVVLFKKVFLRDLHEELRKILPLLA